MNQSTLVRSAEFTPQTSADEHCAHPVQSFEAPLELHTETIAGITMGHGGGQPLPMLYGTNTVPAFQIRGASAGGHSGRPILIGP